VIGVALDLDAGTLVFYKNNTSQGTAYSSLSGTFYPAVGDYTAGSSVATANFGQRPFAYTAPSGFKALCTANLTTPLVVKPSTVFDVQLYTGNGSSQTISGLGFSPDLVWAKSRNDTYNHGLVDVVRGVSRWLGSNVTSAEDYSSGNYLTAFNSDGFDVGGGGVFNASSITYAAWCWDAGTTTDPANEEGSISSQVRANVTAGFSIVTHTSTGAAGTVGHGLGVQPLVVLTKVRSTTSNWEWRTTVIDGSHDYLLLNSTAAKGDSAAAAPTSTVFTDVWNNGDTVVTYCFAPVVGYSSFGSYTGNGSSDGPFVYTGFRPRWIMIKASSAGGAAYQWSIWDTSRGGYNPITANLWADTSEQEYTSSNYALDATANGFKLRTDSAARNQSGVTYIYAAFAESPFNYARAR
jgi:hypothetical protein